VNPRRYKYFKDEERREPFLSMKDEAARKAFLQELHLLKTDLFMQVGNGVLITASRFEYLCWKRGRVRA
jgi:hypothetical protein